MFKRSILGLLAAGALLVGCSQEGSEVSSQKDVADPSLDTSIPDWSRNVIWYQIFPERFRNGDSTNDPTAGSTEFPDILPESWAPTPWTSDWYDRADWERQLGPDFYEDGVFHRRYGGDLQGVIDKLDYIADLGITGIYFNPVFYARSLHKYDGNSFHHIDPYFGPDPDADFALMATESADPSTWQWTQADKLFLELIEQAHARGIRIVIDGVFNHTGRGFFAFEDIVANQAESPYVDWYIVNSFDDPATEANEFTYKGWWGVETLPEFADNAAGDDLHPGPKQYVMDACRRWMDPDEDGNPSDGIDGWRLDVANEVPMGFWTDWNEALRQINPDVYTVTEIWDDASAYLSDGGFSATMNYHGFAFPTKAFLIDEKIPPSEFGELLEERRALYPEKAQLGMQNYIESHDTDRLASMIVNKETGEYRNLDRFDFDEYGKVSPRHSETYLVRAPNVEERTSQRLVATFQYMYVGAPVLYYGTEAGMWGADDPDDRKPMVWEDLDYADEVANPRGNPRDPDPVAFDENLFTFYKSLAQYRHNHEAIRRGSFHVTHTDDANGIFAFERSTENERIWVVLNTGTEHVRLSPPEGAVIREMAVFAGSGHASTQLGIGGRSAVVVMLEEG